MKSHGFPMGFPIKKHHLDPGKQLQTWLQSVSDHLPGRRCLGLPPVLVLRGNCPRTKPSSDFLVPAIRWLGNSIRSSVADSQFNRQLGELGNRNSPWHAPFIALSIHHWIGHVQNHQPLVIHQPIPTNTNHSSTNTT